MSGDPFYKSKAWLAVRQKVLARDCWVCVQCGAGLKGKAKASVDHIKPRRLYPALALAPSNLQSLCKACHDGWKQVLERNEHKPQTGLDGFPAGW